MCSLALQIKIPPKFWKSLRNCLDKWARILEAQTIEICISSQKTRQLRLLLDILKQFPILAGLLTLRTLEAQSCLTATCYMQMY